MTIAIVLVIVAAAVALFVVITLRNRSAHSSVDSFRRQIDALGPEARRNVVDQVQNHTEPAQEEPNRDEPGQDGARGT